MDKKRLSLNIVKTEFTQSTLYTIGVVGQDMRRVKLNNKWCCCHGNSSGILFLLLKKTVNFTRISSFLNYNTGGLSDLKVLVSMI